MTHRRGFHTQRRKILRHKSLRCLHLVTRRCFSDEIRRFSDEIFVQVACGRVRRRRLAAVSLTLLHVRQRFSPGTANSTAPTNRCDLIFIVSNFSLIIKLFLNVLPLGANSHRAP